MPSGLFSSKEGELEETYDYYLKTFNYDREVASERLKFQGYIYWQRKLVEQASFEACRSPFATLASTIRSNLDELLDREFNGASWPNIR